jgi:hypothetical protein
MSMTPAQTAAAMHGLATNEGLSHEQRLTAALQALAFYAEDPRVIKLDSDVPDAWRDLIVGLALLSRGHANDISPLYCAHDELTVCANPEEFHEEELAELEMLGFFVEDEAFKSVRFGSE